MSGSATTLTTAGTLTYPVTGYFGSLSNSSTTVLDERTDLVTNLVMVCGTSRTVQSFNNSAADSTTGTWLCQEHHDIFIANGGMATGSQTYDAGLIINAALAWSSAMNLSSSYMSQPLPHSRARPSSRPAC